MMNIRDQLASVTHFEVRVQKPDQTYVGFGHIDVETFGDGIVWREKGRWMSGALSGMRFTNSTAWHPRDDDGIELSHLRQGDRSPTYLVCLRPSKENGIFVSEAGHICGRDIYRVSLFWRKEGLELLWHVESPTDAYEMKIVVG